jgi:hypothetical protein
VHVLEGKEDAGCEKSGLLFVEFMLSADVVAKVSSWHKIHDEVEGVSVLEGLPHIDDESMLEPPEKLSLVANGLVALLCENPE